MLVAAVLTEPAPCTAAAPIADALARRAADGDHDAFAELYRQHAARVYALLLRLCGWHEARAQDLQQDVFVKVWQALPGFRFESAFATWLHRLAVNTALMALRAGRDAADTDTDALETLPDARCEHARPALAHDLEAGIARLPPRARAVLVLFDIEGWTHEEIAAELGMAVGSSKAQLHRARGLLRNWLGES